MQGKPANASQDHLSRSAPITFPLTGAQDRKRHAVSDKRFIVQALCCTTASRPANHAVFFAHVGQSMQTSLSLSTLIRLSSQGPKQTTQMYTHGDTESHTSGVDYRVSFASNRTLMKGSPVYSLVNQTTRCRSCSTKTDAFTCSSRVLSWDRVCKLRHTDSADLLLPCISHCMYESVQQPLPTPETWLRHNVTQPCNRYV